MGSTLEGGGEGKSPSTTLADGGGPSFVGISWLESSSSPREKAPKIFTCSPGFSRSSLRPGFGGGTRAHALPLAWPRPQGWWKLFWLCFPLFPQGMPRSGLDSSARSDSSISPALACGTARARTTQICVFSLSTLPAVRIVTKPCSGPEGVKFARRRPRLVRFTGAM